MWSIGEYDESIKGPFVRVFETFNESIIIRNKKLKKYLIQTQGCPHISIYTVSITYSIIYLQSLRLQNPSKKSKPIRFFVDHFSVNERLRGSYEVNDEEQGGCFSLLYNRA